MHCKGDQLKNASRKEDNAHETPQDEQGFTPPPANWYNEDNLTTGEYQIFIKTTDSATGGMTNPDEEIQSSCEASHGSERTPLISRELQSEEAVESSNKALGPKTSEYETVPWWKRPSAYWLMPPFLLLTLASGGLAISQVDVIIKILCRQYKAEGSLVSGTGDDGACQELKPVQELYAQFMLHANLLSSILGAISTPFIETISARSSRVKILALTTMGPCLIDILIVTISRYSDQVSVQWVLLGFFLDGICGSFIATNALAHTYITECTAPENRTVLFGYFHGCLFIGATVGPSLGIFINKVSSNQLTIFYVAIVCHLIFFTFLGCVVPDSPRQKDGGVTSDSSPPESQDNCRSGISSRFQAWVRAVKKSRPYALVKILTTHVEGSSGQIRANLLILLLIDSVTSSVATAYMTISIAYTKFRFNWDNVRSTIFVSIEHLTALFTLFVILPLLKKLQTVRERKRQRTVSEDPSSHPPPESLDSTIIRSGVLLQTAGFLGLSLAENGNFFILSSSFAALSAIASPAILSSLTKLVPEQQAGQLLGLVGVLHSVTRIMATAFFEYIYQHTVSQFAPAVLFCMFGTLALALVLSLGVRANAVFRQNPL